jgi:fatty-acyl-CoA synthase
LLALPAPCRTPIRAAYTGGSVLPTELADAFEAHTGIPVRNILGMTECSGMLTVEPFHVPRTPGSTGLPLPFTQITIEDPASGALLGPGQTGLVVVRGPHVSPGYVGRPSPNDTFRADGALASGDLGRLDQQGRLFITGRAKDVIIRGSHNIDPGAIEDALLEHPAVALAAAVGLPDTYAGELPSVFVTLRPGASATPAELAAFAAERVPEPAAAPKLVWIIEEMPLTPVGKIYKPSLRAQAARHAVRAALRTVAPDLAGVDDGDQPNEVVVTVAGLNPERETAMRDAVRGMPLSVRFVPA